MDVLSGCELPCVSFKSIFCSNPVFALGFSLLYHVLRSGTKSAINNNTTISKKEKEEEESHTQKRLRVTIPRRILRTYGLKFKNLPKALLRVIWMG